MNVLKKVLRTRVLSNVDDTKVVYNAALSRNSIPDLEKN